MLNEDIIRMLHIPDEVIEQVAQRELQELNRRERLYRGDHPLPDVHDRIVILVDDGLATGASMRAAVAALRAQKPKRIVVAVPTAAPETCEAFEGEVDEVVCAITPEPFLGVGRGMKTSRRQRMKEYGCFWRTRAGNWFINNWFCRRLYE